MLSFGNFFHFNVTAGNFESLLPIEIHGNALSVTETVYCDRLALPPHRSATTHAVTSDHLLLCPFHMFVMSSHSFILPNTGTSGMSLAALQYIYTFVLTFFSSVPPSQIFLGSFQALEVISAVIACSEAWEVEAAAGSGVRAYWHRPALTAVAQLAWPKCKIFP